MALDLNNHKCNCNKCNNIDEVPEILLGTFIDKEIFIKETLTEQKHCDIFYGYNYNNWNDLRLSCDLCNECSIGGLKINFGLLAEKNKSNFFKLNDVKIVDDPENSKEYNIASYYECSDISYFKE